VHGVDGKMVTVKARRDDCVNQ